MVQVCLFRGAPFLITSLKSVFGADHFSFKEGSQGRVIFCQACGEQQKLVEQGSMHVPDAHESHTLDSKIATEIGLGHINMFNLNIDIIDLAVWLLSSSEFAAWTEKRGVVR